MILPETEAKTKRCPFARQAIATFDIENVQPVTVNRHGIGRVLPACCCLGSDCMAWQPFPDHPTPYGTCGLVR